MIDTSTVNYLSTADVADILQCDRKTVLNLVNRRQIPALKIGKLVRIHPADFEKFCTKYTTGGRSNVHSTYNAEGNKRTKASWPL